MSKDDEVKQFVENHVMPFIAACIELLSKSTEQEDIDFAEELRQLT